MGELKYIHISLFSEYKRRVRNGRIKIFFVFHYFVNIPVRLFLMRDENQSLIILWDYYYVRWKLSVGRIDSFRSYFVIGNSTKSPTAGRSRHSIFSKLDRNQDLK